MSQPPPPNADSALPWASVVSGNSEENLGHVNSSSPPAVASGLDNSLTESSVSDHPIESIDDNNNAGRQRTVWNRPVVNGVVEPVTVMGGTVSWPALSETTRPVSRSFPDNSRPVSDGSVSVSQAPLLTDQPTPRPGTNDNVHSNSAVNNPMPTRPRARTRNGSNFPGTGPSQNAFNQPPIQMPPPPFPFGMLPPILDTSGVRVTRPIGGLGNSSSRNGSDRNNSRRGGYGGRSRGDGHYNNNHGGRRDQGRRDIHHTSSSYPPPPIGYIPSHLLPGVPPFIAPPPVRVFPGQMGFEMASPFMYYPPMPLESFRPMPIIPPPPPSPPIFPENSITNKILKQIDFYFSDDNLVNDDFLRGKMDDQGWVPISLIATFRRVQQLTNDIPLILESLRYSTVVEVEVEGENVRRRNDWQKWLPQRELLNSDSGSQVHNLTNYIRGVSLVDATRNLNNNEGTVMEGHSDITSVRTGQSSEEAHAISV